MKHLKTCIRIALILSLTIPAVIFAAGAKEESSVAGLRDTLNVALEGEPINLDPTIRSNDVVEYIACHQICDNLLTYSYDGKMTPSPNIISEWKWENDTTLWFKIRSDIKFHNGKTLTVKDIVYTIDRIKDPKTGSTIASYVEPIDKVEMIDSTTGKFLLKYPFAPLTTYVLMKVYIVPEGSGNELKTKPTGSGPFKLKEWVMGEKIVLERNENYWKGAPNIKYLVFKFATDYQAGLNGLFAGDVDVITWLGNADAEVVSNKPGLVVEAKDLFGVFYLGINHEREPWNNQKLRQALMYGIDKNLCLQSSQMGYGSTADINVTEESPFYSAEFNYTRNIEKGNALLKEAGFYNKIEVELVGGLTPTEAPLTEAAANSLSQMGINVKPLIIPDPEYVDKVLVNRDYDLMICGYSGVPDPDFFDFTHFHSNGASNYFNYKNPEMDKWLEIGRKSTNLEDRKRAYQNVHRIMIEDVPVVWIEVEARLLARSEKVKNLKWNRAKYYDYSSVVVEK